MKVVDTLFSFSKEMFYPAFLRSMGGAVGLTASSVVAVMGLGYLITY